MGGLGQGGFPGEMLGSNFGQGGGPGSMMQMNAENRLMAGQGGITAEMINNNQRQQYGPITLSNGAIYTGELLNGMKDGYGE